MTALEKYPSLAAAGQAVRDGALSSEQLVEALLDRIEQRNDALQAFVLVDRENALARARQLDRIAARGTRLPLHGLTVGVKDIIDVAGLPTRAASPLRSDDHAAEDAEIVRRFKTAGAVILGKTVTTEWAFLDPPPTRNPWNLDRTPGGSSSGSAVAVAAQMCHVALGTQTGGSVIRPAAFCGMFGMMFVRDDVPCDGILPLAPTLDRPGIIAGSAAGLIACYEAIVSHGPVSPQGIGTTDELKIRVLRAPLTDTADETVQAVFDAECRRLPEAFLAGGIKSTVSDCELVREFDGVAEAHSCVMAYEAAETHRLQFEQSPGEFGPQIGQLVRRGIETSKGDYEVALRRLGQWAEVVNRLTHEGEIIVMPSAPTTAPSRETTGDPRFNAPWTAAGVPVVTVPIGAAGDGMPVGMQLISTSGFEDRLLGVAGLWERNVAFPEIS